MKLQKPFSPLGNAEANKSTGYLARLIDGTTRELSEVVLGRNFITATLENGTSRAFIMHPGLSSLVPVAGHLPFQISRTHKTVGELLYEARFPLNARFWYLVRPDEIITSRVEQTLRGFLVLERQFTMIPLASLGYLELDL